ncbi:MAG TPA: PP2C family protein-serine/threonine phosphatase, partial [Thermoanaerobaculia bacterium]|nr:PP2C family protein-serine/threonine phosphatase [Thermoanaerobaculia bacterium]
GTPREVQWLRPGFEQFFTSPLQQLTPRETEPFLRLLTAPGETLIQVPTRGEDAWTFFRLFPEPRPAQHVAIVLLPGNQVIARRSPGTIQGALARAHRFDLGTLVGRSLPSILQIALVSGLFFFLVSRGRIDLKNAALLAGLTFVASVAVFFETPANRLSMSYVFTQVAARAVWVFLAWAAGESFIRSTSPEFTTSLDALRVGRLGPRGGRALISGLGLGGLLSGLLLLFAALAVALPGIWLEAPSLRLPIFGWRSPIADGIALAAEALVLLALSRRLLPASWSIPGAAFAGAFFITPLSLHPHLASFVANFLLLCVLFYGGRRYGLTAFLTAAIASFLLPAAAFSALHLNWLPGSFALTAGDSVGLLLLGIAGLRRSPEVEMGRLVPPAFMRRLEEERRLRYEMDLLARMQTGLLPENVPALPGWEIAARSLLATEAGGDLYDFLRSGRDGSEEDHLWIAAGDVAGHGYSCSIVQAMTTAALTSLIAPERAPSQVLKEVDRVIRRGGSRRNFTSLALLRLDVTTGEALLANAGHPYPLLFTANGTVEEVTLPGLPLGQGPRRDYTDLTLSLPPGSVLLLCSDGLFEAADWSGTPYGYDRPREILRLVARRPAEAILEALLTDWRRHLQNEEPPDDTTVLVLKRLI